MKYTQAWVEAAIRGAPGPGAEVTRQVIEATHETHLPRIVAVLNEWAAANPGAENNPDYWRDFKPFAIERLSR